VVADAQHRSVCGCGGDPHCSGFVGNGFDIQGKQNGRPERFRSSRAPDFLVTAFVRTAGVYTMVSLPSASKEIFQVAEIASLHCIDQRHKRSRRFISGGEQILSSASRME
jgi:hypothetical protein